MLASIQVALITNGDKGRLDYLEPRLANLEQILSTRFDVHCFCIRFQPDQNPLLFPTSLIKDFLFQTTLSDWRVYCGGQRSRIKEGYQAARVVVKHLRSRRTDRQKAATIEVAVTAKGRRKNNCAKLCRISGPIRFYGVVPFGQCVVRFE